MRSLAVFASMLLVLLPSSGSAVQVGIGLSAGASFPLAQSDNGSGGAYAARVPVNVLPLLTVEPFLSTTALGDAETSIADRTYTREGFDILSYGAVLALGGVGMGPRFPVYPFVGVGASHLSREGATPGAETMYMLGVGWARALPRNLAVNLRTDFNWISVDGTARRFWEMSLGVSLRLHPMPEEGF